MTRTLLISDLHVGARRHASVLEHPEALERLLDELSRTDRVVLLGDIVELVGSRPAVALPRGRPILDAIGRRIGHDGEVIVVPGNHDRALVRGWIRQRGRALGAAEDVPADASAALEQVTGWLSGAGRVRVSYPGVWLADGVWATHGHYLNRHLMPVSNWGRLRGRRAEPPDDRALPSDYERGAAVPVGSVMRRLSGPVHGAGNALGRVARAAAAQALQYGLFDPRLAPLTSRLLSLQMRRHALPAMARVVRRLGVEAGWVVFGHVHRLGPLTGEDPAEWRGPDDGPRLVNTGSWLYEPRLVHGVIPPHPYWPGGGVVLEPGRPPRAVGLLDEFAAQELRPGRG